MCMIVVLVGVRVAQANDSRDLIVAAVVGASGVGLLATVPGDDTLLASLLLTRIVISAALGLLVREQRRGAGATSGSAGRSRTGRNAPNGR